jgi:hypothetical protein
MIFMIGWASGGVLFGVLGDRIGRARTMIFTILLYAAFTGLSVFPPAYGISRSIAFLLALELVDTFLSLSQLLPRQFRIVHVLTRWVGCRPSQPSEICSPLSSAFCWASFRSPVRFRIYADKPEPMRYAGVNDVSRFSRRPRYSPFRPRDQRQAAARIATSKIEIQLLNAFVPR